MPPHFLRQISHQWISFKENDDFNKSFSVYDCFMTNSITPYPQIDTSKLTHVDAALKRIDPNCTGSPACKLEGLEHEDRI